MKGKVSIINDPGDGRVTINIEGVIGVPERMQFEDAGDRVSTFNSLWTLLDRVTGHSPRSVTVNIRSTGGSVGDALLIYDFLKSCGAEVTTRCFGYAASAATIIAQAASPGMREVSANCLYLIHNSSCETEGNRLEMESAAGMLRQTDERIAGIYALNSGRRSGEFTALMGENGGKGRWLSPVEVVAYGLADKVIDSGRLGRRDRRMVKNLGLPPLPGKNPFTDSIKSTGEKITRVLRGARTLYAETIPGELSGENKNPRESKTPVGNLPDGVMGTKTNTEFCPVNTGEVPEKLQSDIRKSIMPAATKPKEDPSVYGNGLSRNEEAYLEDLRSIKTV